MILDILSSAGDLRQPASCIVKIDNKASTWLYPYIESVDVTNKRQGTGTAKIICKSIVGPDGAWEVTDNDKVEENKPISIEVKFGPQSTLPLFTGKIQKITPNFSSMSDEITVTIDCQDLSIDLDRQHKRVSWQEDEKMSDTRFLKEALKQNKSLTSKSLKLHRDTDDGEMPFPKNSNETNINFILKRAKENAYDCYIIDDELYFGPPRLKSSPSPEKKIYVRAGRLTNTTNFQIKHDPHVADEVEFVVLNDKGTDIEVITLKSKFTQLGTISSKRKKSNSSKNKWAAKTNSTPTKAKVQALNQAKINQESFNITATGKLDGSLFGDVLHVGRTISVVGAGLSYDGIHYVDAVTHNFTSAGYIQNFALIRNGLGPGRGETLGSPISKLSKIMGGF